MSDQKIIAERIKNFILVSTKILKEYK